MSNPVVQWMQARIGQSMTSSPSPVSRWIGGTLRSVQEGEVTIEVPLRPDMTNPAGILHGGVLSLIMDDVIGTAVYSLGRENFYTTVNLVVDYLNSSQPGEIITASARVVRAGKTIVNAECTITNAAGKLLARGTSNLLYTQNVVRVG